jgi:hypothetical protein
MGYEVGSHFVGDLVHHASDIHHALGRARIDDDEALAVGFDFYLDSCHNDLVAQDAGALGVHATDPPEERWTLGAGSEVATLEASGYALVRALGGRRSQRQIRAMDWTGDVDAMVAVLSRYPSPPATSSRPPESQTWSCPDVSLVPERLVHGFEAVTKLHRRRG